MPVAAHHVLHLELRQRFYPHGLGKGRLVPVAQATRPASAERVQRARVCTKGNRGQDQGGGEGGGGERATVENKHD